MRTEMRKYEFAKEETVVEISFEKRMREFIKFLRGYRLNYLFLSRLDYIVREADLDLLGVCYTDPLTINNATDKMVTKSEATCLMLKFDSTKPLIKSYNKYEISFVFVIRNVIEEGDKKKEEFVTYSDHIVMDNYMWRKFCKYIYGILTSSEYEY